MHIQYIPGRLAEFALVTCECLLNSEMKASSFRSTAGRRADRPRHAPAATRGRKVIVRTQAVGINFADIMSAAGGYPGTPRLHRSSPVASTAENSMAQSPCDGIRTVGSLCGTVAGRAELPLASSRALDVAGGRRISVNYFRAYLATGRRASKPGNRGDEPRVLTTLLRGAWYSSGANRANCWHRNVWELPPPREARRA